MCKHCKSFYVGVRRKSSISNWRYDRMIQRKAWQGCNNWCSSAILEYHTNEKLFEKVNSKLPKLFYL